MNLRGVPVVLVHGAFVGGWSFDAFRQPFEAAGAKVVVPDLRGHAPGDPAEAVRGLSMADYARDIAAVCAACPEPPVLIGHSLGGLVAQLAAAKAKVRASVLLAPSPPWGVVGSSLEEAIAAFGLQMMGAFWTQAAPPNLALMLEFGLDRMPAGQRRPVLERMRAESGRALWETLNWWMDPFMTTHVGFSAARTPTLILNGDRDRIHTVGTAQRIAGRLGADLRVLPGMSHWLVGEPGWEKAAAEAVEWLGERALQPAH